jgi:hypothetical protein
MVVFGLYLVRIKVDWNDYNHFLYLNIYSEEPIRRRYVRNPNQEEFNDGKILVFRGDDHQFDDKAFVPVEIKAGKQKQSYYQIYVHYIFLIQVMLFLFMVK